ncbi:hypothetical protein P3T18_003965 [Paraburkholderia sp. GAS199]|uniref:DUF4148 domain-containing protein n=1 Tax=Paraburkholderia sp. GAS199 TaxID=3035126 RepID=UPI003D254541
MKTRLALTLSMILLASAGAVTNASAQEKTRAEVRQELIQAENNGLNLVTDTSYPEINPIYAQQAAQEQAQAQTQAQATQSRDTDVGGSMAGSSATGQRAPAHMTMDPNNCVGPVSFCSLYFGS